MPLTSDALTELRDRIRAFSERIEEYRETLGDEFTRDLVQICDAGVILGGHAIPAGQRMAVKDARIEKLQERVRALEVMERRFYAAQHHARRAAQAYEKDFDDEA